jgi:hypothetical protein
MAIAHDPTPHPSLIRCGIKGYPHAIPHGQTSECFDVRPVYDYLEAPPSVVAIGLLWNSETSQYDPVCAYCAEQLVRFDPHYAMARLIPLPLAELEYGRHCVNHTTKENPQCT